MAWGGFEDFKIMEGFRLSRSLSADFHGDVCSTYYSNITLDTEMRDTCEFEKIDALMSNVSLVL